MARVRLTRKLALVLNGVDVSGVNVGDVFEVSEADAALLIAERWAEPVTDADDVSLSGESAHPRKPEFKKAAGGNGRVFSASAYSLPARST